MLLVTGADRSHGASLRQMLRSVARHEPDLRIVVYDLGLTARQRLRIGKRQQLEWRRFEFEKYPAYFDIRVKAGEYAWKPVIIADLLEEAGEPVLWFDGQTQCSRRLLRVRSLLRRGTCACAALAGGGPGKGLRRKARIRFKADGALKLPLSGWVEGSPGRAPHRAATGPSRTGSSRCPVSCERTRCPGPRRRQARP